MRTVHQRYRQTDKQTDEQTDGRLTIAIRRFALLASRGNKMNICNYLRKHKNYDMK